MATGFAAGTAFVACGVSVVCGVTVGVGAVVVGGSAHLGVDYLSHDSAHDFGIYQAFAHSFSTTATSALCVYTLGGTCLKSLAAGGLTTFGAGVYLGFNFIDKWMADITQGIIDC